MKIRFFAALLIASAFLTGCESTKTASNLREPTYQDARNDQFIPVNREAAKHLLTQLGYNVPAPSTLIIASLANVDALERSSTLGRIISEQVSAEFTRTGYRMRELKLRSNIYIQEQGELMLTREVRELARNYDAQAIVVGTYATSRDFVYVNLKVVHPQSNVVLAVHDYALPMNRNIRRMLSN